MSGGHGVAWGLARAAVAPSPTTTLQHQTRIVLPIILFFLLGFFQR